MTGRKSKKTVFSLLGGILLPCGVTAVLLGFTSALGNLESGHRQEDILQLEEVLRKSCVSCYASEGIYPLDLNYLKEHYGVQIDEEHYIVYYDRFAQNLMPDITVLEVQPVS